MTALTDNDVARSPTPREVTIVANDVGAVGGMERVLAELIAGLRDSGHQVTVIARTCVLADAAGVVFRRVRGPRRPFLLAYPWFVLAGSLAVRRWRRGIVQATGAIVLSRVDAIAVHYCHQVGPAHSSRANVLFRAHVKAVGLLKRVAERACFARNPTAAYVCVSEGVAAEMREHYPRLAGRVRVIHNGVDTRRFAPGLRADHARALRARLDIADGRLVAAFVGSEWERKGLRPLIRALARAPGWDLVVAGDGDRERYNTLADSLGVGEAVRWLGVTADVQPVYQLADAFVLPSSYETFSLVAFEAAASGLPVVACPVSGVRELIRDGESGFLIEPDPAAIAACLGRLADDPKLRAGLGRAARQAALAFNWQATVAGHEDLYRELAQARPRPRSRSGLWSRSGS